MGAAAGRMTAWTATWGPDAVRIFWELTITDEHGNVAMRERSHALCGSPHPDDRLLETMGIAVPKCAHWERGEGGTWSCPVLASEDREEELLAVVGKPAPGEKVPAPEDESPLMRRVPGITPG